MYNAANGTIENNTIYNSSHGDGIVQIALSEGISIINNTIHNCEVGIMKMLGSSSLISNNTIFNTSLGTVILASDSNIIYNNTIFNSSVGILVGLSDYNLFADNTIHDITGGWNPEPGININAGIYVESSYENNFTNNMIFSCAYEGIFLNRSSNSFLNGNTIYDCFYDGIIVDSSNNLMLKDNIIHDCGEAIILVNCNDSILYENTIFNTDDDLGIYLESGNNNTFSTNTIYNSAHGIYLEFGGNCDNNTIVSNTIYNCSEQGIYIRDSKHNTLSGNTIYDCTLEGIKVDSLSYYNLFFENTIYSCQVGVYIQFSHNNTFIDNTIYDITSYGIAVFDGDNNTLSGNTVYNCTFGIPVASPNVYYNNLTGNTVYNCEYGISVVYSSNNTISYNMVYNNTNYGLSIKGSSENNTVTMNNFIDNNVGYPSMEQLQSQALDDWKMNNIFSNYWSDWSGTGIYSIDQTLNGFTHLNNDSSPLVDPVLPTLSIITPIVQEYGVDTIAVMLSENPLITEYWYFIYGVDSQNQTWTESVDRTLPDGDYTLNAYGSDIFGNTVYESVPFTIDANLPTVTITSPTETTYTDINVPLTYTAANGVVAIYLNGMANTTAVPSGSVVSDFPDTPDIPDGIYNITIVVTDGAGNIAKTTIIFTIDAVEDTTTTATTTTVTTTSETTTEITTTSKTGSFTEFVSILIFFGLMSIFIRKRKKI